MSGIEVGWLAVEVDRTTVAYFVVVVTVFESSFQADAFCVTSVDVEVITWAATVRLRIKTDVNISPIPPRVFSYAELVACVVVTNYCVPVGAVICGAERVR